MDLEWVRNLGGMDLIPKGSPFLSACDPLLRPSRNSGLRRGLINIHDKMPAMALGRGLPRPGLGGTLGAAGVARYAGATWFASRHTSGCAAPLEKMTC